MEFVKFPSRKSKAQAIVEFAIALPILLLLVYGILEVGRYLFLYSTVVNASRQGVRYASATGLGDGGTPGGNAGVPRYQDCNGIRAATSRGAYVATFDQINISWDEGPADNTPTTYCTGSTDNSLTASILSDNSHRVTVEVREEYIPIVSRLIPFTQRTIVASSSRTVLLSVSIEVTSASTLNPLYSRTPSPSATITPSESATPTRTSTPTRTYTPITHTATNSRTPSPTTTPSFTFTPSNTPTPSRTPTSSRTPTITPTAINNCNLVTHGPEVISGTELSMTITNPTGVDLVILDITAFWDHDSGHKTGSDKTLRLESIDLGGSIIWSGNVYAPTFNYNPPGLLVIPPGTTTITFTFHQTYSDTGENSQRIFINLETNGCQGFPIDSDS